MFQLILSDSKQINLCYKSYLISYGLDGNLPNPSGQTVSALWYNKT
jgi:hypothetical protein